jgi:hypothetical protein
MAYYVHIDLNSNHLKMITEYIYIYIYIYIYTYIHIYITYTTLQKSIFHESRGNSAVHNSIILSLFLLTAKVTSIKLYSILTSKTSVY